MKTHSSTPAPRPYAIFIMQLLMLAAAPFFLIFGFAVASAAGPLKFAICMAAAAWALAILACAYRRTPALRWVGAPVIGVIITAMLLSVRDGELIPTHSAQEHTFHMISSGVVTGLLIYWLYAFAFSAKARRYLGLAG